eukprot:792499-Pleurochrysis_carterae.AAC.1
MEAMARTEMEVQPKNAKKDGKSGSDAANEEKTPEDSPIFRLVVAAMQKQSNDFALDPSGMELTFFKSLVRACCDTSC